MAHLLAPVALLALLEPGQLETARRATAALFPDGEAYSSRLRLGRQAQLGGAAGDEQPMVYRPGLIETGAPAVESALTYGEYDLSFFAALVDAALCAGGREPAGATFVDVGSGCGRLVCAAAALWPQLARSAGIERVDSLHQLALESLPRARELLPQGPALSFHCGDAHELLCSAQASAL